MDVFDRLLMDLRLRLGQTAEQVLCPSLGARREGRFVYHRADLGQTPMVVIMVMVPAVIYRLSFAI